MSKSFQDWLSEGEQLYDSTLREYQGIEAQLDDLMAKLAAKQSEVNQIAHVIGKPTVENNQRLTAEIIDQTNPTNNSTPSIIARALTGKQIHR